MVIDSHEHIMFPRKTQLEKMDAAGVDRTNIQKYLLSSGI